MNKKMKLCGSYLTLTRLVQIKVTGNTPKFSYHAGLNPVN